MVTSITLLVVLDRLCIAHAAGRCPRRGAWGLFRNLVAAAVFVYDLGTHVGGTIGAGKARPHGGGKAPPATAWEEGETAGGREQGRWGWAQRGADWPGVVERCCLVQTAAVAA